MAKITVTFRTMDFGPVWLVGSKTIVQQGKTAGNFVRKFRQDGTNAYLQGLDCRVSPAGDIIIWMGESDPEKKTFAEIPGILVSPNCDIDDTFDIRPLPHCTMGLCVITGNTRNLTGGAHNKLTMLIKESGYEPDYSYGFSMEYYSYEKYEKDRDEYEFTYMLPCKLMGRIAE